MKTVKFSTLLPILFLFLAFSAGCKCAFKNCGSHGDCNAGVCECEEGYELDAKGKCETEIRSKFIGTWESYMCGQSTAHQIVISPVAGKANTVLIENFADLECTPGNRVAAYATIDNNYRNVLHNMLSACNGPGNLAIYSSALGINDLNNLIVFDYSYMYYGNPESCKITYTKKQ